jgi:hypothetical protein
MEPTNADDRIEEFRNIAGRGLSDDECRRVLDVCDWDVNVRVGVYFLGSLKGLMICW